MSVPNQRNQPRGRYFSNVARNLNSMRITAGKGVKVSQTGSGVTISAKGGEVNGGTINASGESVVAMIVEGGGSLEGYSIICYPNFPAKTGSFGARLAVVEIALGAELPVGTYVIAHLAAMTKIGGGA